MSKTSTNFLQNNTIVESGKILAPNCGPAFPISKFAFDLININKFGGISAQPLTSLYCPESIPILAARATTLRVIPCLFTTTTLLCSGWGEIHSTDDFPVRGYHIYPRKIHHPTRAFHGEVGNSFMCLFMGYCHKTHFCTPAATNLLPMATFGGWLRWSFCCLNFFLRLLFLSLL